MYVSKWVKINGFWGEINESDFLCLLILLFVYIKNNLVLKLKICFRINNFLFISFVLMFCLILIIFNL